MFAINQADAEAADNLVEGTLLVCGFEAKILFDTGSTHSFMSPNFSKLIDMPARGLEYVLTVSTPVGKQLVCRKYYPRCAIKIGDVELPANLIL